MRLFGPYVFSLLLIGVFGLCLGHMSRSGEVSMLKEWLSYMPNVVEKQITVLQFVPLPFVQLARRSTLATKGCEQSLLVAHEQDSSLLDTALAADKNHMKQIAHVHVPQNNSLSDVSKTSQPKQRSPFNEHADLNEEIPAEYKKHLEHVSTLLSSVNHEQKQVRMLARLELAQVRAAGPLSKYIQDLVTSLLVRYCNEDGKLINCDQDTVIVTDIEKAVSLLTAELSDGRGWGHIARADFAPMQRKVQRHAYNGALKAVLTSNYIPCTVG